MLSRYSYDARILLLKHIFSLYDAGKINKDLMIEQIAKAQDTEMLDDMYQEAASNLAESLERALDELKSVLPADLSSPEE